MGNSSRTHPPLLSRHLTLPNLRYTIFVGVAHTIFFGGPHGVPRKHFLFPFCLSMEFPWIFHGFPIDFPWNSHELQNVSVVIAGTPPGVRKQSRRRQVMQQLADNIKGAETELAQKNVLLTKTQQGTPQEKVQKLWTN